MVSTSSYIQTALMAAHAERARSWLKATLLWEQSSLKANTPENCQWAKKRAEHCRARMNACHLLIIEQGKDRLAGQI